MARPRPPFLRRFSSFAPFTASLILLTVPFPVAAQPEPPGSSASDPETPSPAAPTESDSKDPGDGIPTLDFPFRPGEEIVLSGRAWKGTSALGIDVGTVTFRVADETKDGRRFFLYTAVADGSAFGFELKSTLTARADAETGIPLIARDEKGGSSPGIKELHFPDSFPGKVAYYKTKHCKKEGCRIEGHFIDGGPSGRRHCPSCDAWEHKVLTLRQAKGLSRPGHDILSMLYRVRALTLKPGGEAEELDCVVNRHLHRMSIRAEKEEDIETPAGKFRALKILFTVKPNEPEGAKAESDEARNFEGPFGLKGDIRIWIEKEKRFPLRVEGTVPFGIDLNVEIELKKYVPGEAVAAPPPGEGKEAARPEGGAGAQIPKPSRGPLFYGALAGLLAGTAAGLRLARTGGKKGGG